MMQKPQIIHGFEVQDGRLEPFVPLLHPDKPFGLLDSQPLVPVEGHGLENRYGNLRTTSMSKDVVAPAFHYPHPYQAEIESLEFPDWQVQVQQSQAILPEGGRGGTLRLKANEGIGIMIDTLEDLLRLVQRIDNDSSVREVAVDLEAHNFHSFSGFVCLMQLSLRRPDSTTTTTTNETESETIDTGYDFLIDTVVLRKHMNACLAPIFANPNVVKVMHGADSDIPWLQRDFGIYLVNLFDTGRAARALSFPSAGLAYLLKQYAGVTADKKHQLSDWRQRPLPNEMRTYAVSDTKYLLDIYDLLKVEITDHKVATMEDVLKMSQTVSLFRYDKEPFKPMGYKTIMNPKRSKGKKSKMVLTPRQERVLKALYDWRDATARECDESLQYVAGNSQLVRISTTCPTSVTALQSLMNPMPPLVLRYSQTILDLIKTASSNTNNTTNTTPEKGESKSQLRASAAPFLLIPSTPSSFSSPGARSSSGFLSPVLGTEALYKEAGWDDDEQDHDEDGTNEEDPGDEDNVPVEEAGENADQEMRMEEVKDDRTLLEVSQVNQDYVASTHMSHSLEFTGGHDRGVTVDGMGAARAALGQTFSGGEEEYEQAKQTALQVREALVNGDALLQFLRGGSTSTTIPSSGVGGNDDQDYDNHNDEEEGEENDESGDENSIPKSMKEIYKISNRNRRRSKKPSMSGKDGETMTTTEGRQVDEMQVDTLEGAEAVLASRGTNGYFGGGKRQRTKSGGGTEDTSATTERDDDVALMQEVGWIKDQKEAQDMVEKEDNYNAASPEEDGTFRAKQQKQQVEPKSGAGTSKQGNSDLNKGKTVVAAPTFDYATVGAIGAYNPKAPQVANPFFTGAAIASNSNSTAPKARKTGKSPTNTKGSTATTSNSSSSRQQPTERPSKGSDRTHVYRRNK
eukprot:scaffold12806_cov55-Attheya_sp.AAC.3